MATGRLGRGEKVWASVVAYDREDRPVLFIWTRDLKIGPETGAHLLEMLRRTRRTIPFGMVADAEDILIYRRDAVDPGAPACALKTREILPHYSAQFSKRERIFSDYLAGLIGAWLRDLAYHWRSKSPPAERALAEIGLLDLLEDGTTRSEVALAAHPLP